MNQKKPWWMAGSAALLAAAITGWIVHYVDAAGASRAQAEAVRKQELGRAEAVKAAAHLQQEKAKALESREKALAAREKDIEEKARLLSAARDAERAAPSVPVKSETPAKPKKGKSGFARMMEMSAKMMDSPAGQEQMRMGMKMQIGAIYGDLLKEWNLSPEAKEAVEGALIDRLMEQMKLGMSMMNEALSEEEILRRQDEMLAKAGEDLTRQLTADQLARLEAYDRDLPRHMMEHQADQTLASLKLDPAIQSQVRSVIVEEQQASSKDLMGMGRENQFGKKTAEDIRRTRAMMSGDTKEMVETFRTASKASQERIRARIQPYLTAEQLAAYQKQQEGQLQMVEMGLKMMESMGGGE